MWQALVKFLRDPAHQGLAVILAIVSIALVLWPYSPKGQITVRTIYAFQPLTNPITKSPEAFEFRYGDLKASMDDISIHLLEIVNDSSKAITPSDIVQPIMLETKNFERIISVSTQTDGDVPPPQWKELAGNRWQLEPTLLNPGDKLKVHLVTVRTRESQGPPQVSTLKWTARIVNVPLRLDVQPLPYRYDGPFADIYVTFKGIHILVLLFFAVYLQYILFKSAAAAAFLPANPLSNRPRFFSVSALGLCCGEVVAHIWTSPPGYLAMIAWFVLAAYVIALLWFRYGRRGANA